jgi:2'-5' RNA ligase
MRLFIALEIEESIRQRIVRFMEGLREFAPDARWVRPESLHVTLKFIGEKSAESVSYLKQAIAELRAKPLTFSIAGHGFFPTPKSARVFWVGIEAGAELGQLARSVDEATARVGVSKEIHSFSPHLTLARGGGRSGSPRRSNEDRNQTFHRLQEKLSSLPPPEFGTMTAREFYLYESRLAPGGAKYSKIERFPLT